MWRAAEELLLAENCATSSLKAQELKWLEEPFKGQYKSGSRVCWWGIFTKFKK